MKVWRKNIYRLCCAGSGCFRAAVPVRGRAAEELTKKLLAEQTALQGTLKAEEIQANWSGDVIFKNVVWVGPDGKTIAEIPLATVSVNLFDALLKGGTGASVGDVVIDKPSFFVSYNKKTV